MISLLSERKVGVIAALVASVLNMIIFMLFFATIAEGKYWIVGLVITVGIDIAIYLLAGGLSVVFDVIKIGWHLGFIIPIFPINIACAIIILAIIVVFIWMFPIIAVLISLIGEYMSMSKENK